MDVLGLLGRVVGRVLGPVLVLFAVLDVVVYVLLLDLLLDQTAASLLDFQALVTEERVAAELTGLLEVERLLADAVLQMIQINASLASFETEVGGDTLLEVL